MARPPQPLGTSHIHRPLAPAAPASLRAQSVLRVPNFTRTPSFLRPCPPCAPPVGANACTTCTPAPCPIDLPPPNAPKPPRNHLFFCLSCCGQAGPVPCGAGAGQGGRCRSDMEHAGPRQLPANAGVSEASQQPRPLQHHRGPGCVSPAWRREKTGRNESGSGVARGCGRALPGSPGPGPAPAATPDTRLPTHCWQHRGAIQPLPASAQNNGDVCLHLRRRPQRGHCHRGPRPSPSAPLHRQPPARPGPPAGTRGVGAG